MIDPLFTQTVSDLLSRGSREDGRLDRDLWNELGAGGFLSIGIAETAGGSGGSVEEAAEFVRLAGKHAASGPVAETSLVAAWLLEAAAAPLPGGVLTAAPLDTRDRFSAEPVTEGWRVRGEAARVPWAAEADQLVVLADAPDGPKVVTIPTSSAQLRRGTNLAGEPRDDVTVDIVVQAEQVFSAPCWADRSALRHRAATGRVLLMSGALERVLELTTSYASTRVQFGRSIDRFQAVGHLIAQLAEEVALARMAANLVTEALESDDLPAQVASAKSVTSRAATTASRYAHQVHGAIGVTREYELQLYTRRLWSWRDELGRPHTWERDLGQRLRRAGGRALWDFVSAQSTAGSLR